MRIQERDESPVTPKAPEVKKPATARPTVRVAGTRTGLKRRKTGVATASPIKVPARVMPARQRRVPPTGRRVTIARICVAEGPF